MRTVGPDHACRVWGISFSSFSLIVNQSLLIGGGPDVQPGVVIAGLLDPEGCIAVGGLAALIGCDVTGDIDGNELVFLVPLILLSDFIGGQTVKRFASSDHHGSRPPLPSHRLPIGSRDGTARDGIPTCGEPRRS